VGLKDQMGIGFKGGLSGSDKGTGRSSRGTNSIVFGSPSEGSVVEVKKVENKQEENNFIKFQNDLNDAIQKDKTLSQYSDNIRVDQTPEGLRIQLLDSKNRPLFENGTDALQPYTKELLQKISAIIRFLPNYISIIGHTTAAAETTPVVAEPWLLSSTRALSTRFYLLSTNMDQEQIAQVVGRGTHDPLNPSDPQAPENMRIELILLKNSVLSYAHKFGDAAVTLKN
jgi:chemotaxis protein MotB